MFCPIIKEECKREECAAYKALMVDDDNQIWYCLMMRQKPF